MHGLTNVHILPAHGTVSVFILVRCHCVSAQLLARCTVLSPSSTYTNNTLWAVFMVAFFGFLRNKELLNLRWQDLERHQEGFRTSITASKTDPFRQGVEIKQSGDRALCVVRAMNCLCLRAAGRMGLVFTFDSGQQIQPQRLNELIGLLASLSNIPVDRYSSHSSRIGASTTAAAAGIPGAREVVV